MTLAITQLDFGGPPRDMGGEAGRLSCDASGAAAAATLYHGSRFWRVRALRWSRPRGAIPRTPGGWRGGEVAAAG